MIILFLVQGGFVPAVFSLSIAASSPQTTEIIYQLGKGQDLIAGSTIAGIKASESLASLGALFTPSLERLIILSPTWVIIDETWSNAALKQSLAAAHLQSLPVKLDRLAALFKESDRILQILYSEKKSSNPPLIRAIDCYAQIPKVKSFNFLALTWLNPPILFGQKTFFADLITQIGGQIIAPKHGPDYPQVSEEWILSQKPEVLYFLKQDQSAETAVVQAVKKWWPNHSPIVIALDPEWFARASFTALSHWDRLYPHQPQIIPASCQREI